jgi:lantibiotic modifying enzyme
MCQHLTRREWLGRAVGAAAAVAGIPAALSALETRSARVFAAPADDLDVALKAEAWIRRSRIATKNGVTWPADPLKPTSIGYDLYNGMPGVVLFYLELYHATEDKKWLEEAKLGANEIEAQIPTLAAANDAGLYTGLGGAVFVLEETHRATGEGRYRDAARKALSAIHEQARKTASGVSWSGPSDTNDIISGTAGIGLVLLWADHMMDDAPSRTLALAAGRQLLGLAIPDKGGTKWAVGSTVKNLYPNFSHGTAGVAYFLSTLLRATGDNSFMAASLSGAKYLEDAANTEGSGFKVFHHEPGGEDLYYLSWCHGPAGTTRLFRRLGEITHRPKWDELVRAGARATIASGVPEKQSPGYWNNISQCCGNCGVGEFFIDLQRHLPAADYPDMIARVRANTLSRATADGDGLKWIQAENRVSPNDVVAQTGYMQGAAGVGSFYLHARALAAGKPRAIEWPDSPNFTPCPTGKRSANDMSFLAGARGKCD